MIDLRVLLINTEKIWRGGERQTLYTLQGLLSEGVKASLLCLKDYPLHRQAQKKTFQLLLGLID